MESAGGANAEQEQPTYTVGVLYVIQRYHQSLNGNTVRLLHHLPDIKRCIVELPGGVELSVPPNVLVLKGSAGAGAPSTSGPVAKTATYLKYEQLPEIVEKVVFDDYTTKPPPKRLEFDRVTLQHTAVSLLSPRGYNQPESKVDVGNLSPAFSQYQRTMVGAVVERLRSSASSYFLGEGVGVGKTRILAGVIAVEDSPSGNRHLWLTASDNIRGIQQELSSVKKGGFSLYPLGFEREIGPIVYGPGVAHCSYSQFASTSRRNGIRRLDAIITWLRGSKGVVVLDDFSQTAIKPNVVTHLGELVELLNGVKVVYASHMLFFQNSDLALCRVLLQNTLNSQNALIKSDTALALNHAGVLSCAFSDLKNLRIQVRDIPTATVISTLIDHSYVIWADLWRTLCELQASGRGAGRTALSAGADGGDSDDERSGDVAGGPKRAFWISHAEYFRSLSLIAKIPAIKDLVNAATSAGKKTAVSLFHTASEGRVDSPKEILMRTIRTIFPELSNMHMSSMRPSFSAGSASASQYPMGTASRPKRKAPDHGRLPYIPSYSKAHTKVDKFGVRVIETSDNPRFCMATNSADFRPPKRQFTPCKNKRALYKIAPKLGPLAEASDDSDAENVNPMASTSTSSASGLKQQSAVPGGVQQSEPFVEQQMKLGQSFVDRVNALPSLPTFSAVDLLVDALGGSTVVAEMTARKSHIMNKMFVRRAENDNATQLAAFLAGNKKIAVTNDLSCVGFNLNCDVHILAELPLMPLRGLQQICRGYTAAAPAGAADAVILCSKLGGERFMAGGLVESLEQFRSEGSDAIRGREVTKAFYYDQMRSKLALDFIVAVCYNPSSYRGTMTLKPNMSEFLQALGTLLEPLGWIPGVERRADSGARFLQRLYGLPAETQEHVFAFFASLMEQVR